MKNRKLLGNRSASKEAERFFGEPLLIGLHRCLAPNFMPVVFFIRVYHPVVPGIYVFSRMLKYPNKSGRLMPRNTLYE